MTGGNQLKLSSIVCGTPVGDAIVAAHQRGAVVGGTSAGASIQSSHMLAFGVGGTTPKQRMTQMAAGLGLLPSTVIDQHFAQRNRYGRLLMIVAQSPQLLGIGVDEDTAAIVRGRRAQRGRPRCRDDPGSDATSPPTPTRPSAPRRCWPAASYCTCCRRAPASTWPPARWCPSGRRVDPLRGRRDRGGGPRPAPDGARHRGRRRLPERAAPAPAAYEEEAIPTRLGSAGRPAPGRRRRMTERPTPDLTDPRDAGLPRRQRLVLRTGDPPRRGPRVAGEVPDQHHPRLHRQPARDAARAARALLLPRQARRLRRAAPRRDLAGPRRRAHGAGAPAGRGPRHPPRQDPPGQGPARPLQRHLRVRRRAGRARGRPPRRTTGQPPRPGRPGVRLGRGARGVHPARRAHGVRPVDPGDPRRGRLAGHPLDPAQPVLAGPARPGRPRQADPRHDDLDDLRDRGRHRLRQGPHHPAARCRRPAGAQAGHRAHRGPGRRARRSGSATRWS